MSSNILFKNIKAYRKSANENPHVHLARNGAVRGDVMDMDIFDYELFYSTDFLMTKADRLEFGDSLMTHAMLFTSVDLDGKGRPRKWRVENSWGDKRGDESYNIMTDSWFDEYNYEVVVHKNYITKDEFSVYQKEPVILPPRDPMGALAKL